MPKMIANPMLISAKLAIAYRTCIAKRAARSTFILSYQSSSSAARHAQPQAGHPDGAVHGYPRASALHARVKPVHGGRPSELDYILLVVVGVLDEIANRGGVGRCLLGEVLEHVELLVFDLGDVDVEDAMMGRRIDRHRARRRFDADARLERLDHLQAIDAACLLHRLRPQQEALVGSHREFGDIGIVGAKPLVEALDERCVDWILEVLEVIVANQHAIALVRRQHNVFVAHRESRGGHRDAGAHTGRGPLAVERNMRAADERGPDEIGFGRLYLGDGRTKIRDVERKEIYRRDFAAVLDHVFLHPLRSDLAVIVIRGDHIDLLAPLLHRVRDQLFDRLRRRDASVELIAVADAALVLRVVEIEGLEPVEHRPDDFARSRGYATMHDGRLVFQRRLLRELRVELHARLRIVVDQLDLPAQQSSRRIRLFDRERQGVDHRLAIDVQSTREIVDPDDSDRLLRKRSRRERAGAERNGRGALQELPTIDIHCATLLVVVSMFHAMRYFFRTDAPIVYFGSTMLPSRMRPAWLKNIYASISSKP